MTQPTSRAALASLDLETLQGRVFRVLQHAGARGLTDEELYDAMRATQPDIKERTAGARRAELARPEVGLVVDSGRVRLTRSNRNAIVWIVATAQGRLGI